MRYHSVNAHPNNTYVRQDGLWKSATGEWYGWPDSDMYACSAAPVRPGWPGDHSECRHESEKADELLAYFLRS